MSSYEVKRTDSFISDLKKFKKVNELFLELDKKIQKLKDEPNTVGKQLHGNLHPSKSTRLCGKYRLIFQVDDKLKIVYLEAIDHRKNIYEN